MADGTDESIPMLEETDTAAECALEPAPLPAEHAKPELSTDTTDADADVSAAPENGPPSGKEQREATTSKQAEDDGVVLRGNGGANNVSGSPPTRPPRPSQSLPLPVPVDKPVKPPRLKSMRSKEGSPLLRPTEETKDIEAAVTEASGPTGDSNLTDIKPYEPTTEAIPEKKDAVQPKKKFGLDYIMNKKWIILGIIGVVLIILIIIIVGVSVSRSQAPKPPAVKVYDDPTVAGLKCGEAVGSWELDHSVAVFKANPASGTDALYIGSEDCLYLNIWTPGLSAEKPADKKNLSVLVYIHGGFLHYGSGHEELFSPSAQLAKEMNAVIVSFNYRLNVFGWLALEEYNDPLTSISGNFGLYDQIQALKWVRGYISNFGGNPNLVTVAGISSGGTSILALLTNEDARATFQRAWISGASTKFDGDKNETLATNRAVYLRNIGCKDGDAEVAKKCLLNKTSEELVEAIPWIQYPSWSAMDILAPPTKNVMIGAVLINDGTYIQKSPSESLASVNTTIPLLIGNGEFETNRYQVVPVETWTWGQYSDYVRSKLDTFNSSYSDYVLNDYAQELKTSTRLHMSRHVSDMRAICPQTFLAEKINAVSSAPIYRYVMTAKTPQMLSDKYLGGSTVATHATDFAMFFHYSDDDNKMYKATKERFRARIKNFMISGNLTDWQPFPYVYNISSEDTSTTSQWTVEVCELWRGFYPDYSWMN